MKTLLIIFVCIANIGFSQDSLKIAMPNDSLRKTFSIGLNSSYGYGYRILKENKNSNDANIQKQIKANNERDFTSIYQSFGINMSHYFKNKLFLSYGLNYNSFNYQTKEIELIPITPDPSVPQKIQYTYQTNTFEMPIYFGYSKAIKKIELLGQVGIGSHLIYQATQTERNWYSIGSVKSKTTFYSPQMFGMCFSLNSMLSFSYNPIKQFSIRLSPEIKYGITSINNTPLQTKILGYGVNLGLFYNIIK